MIATSDSDNLFKLFDCTKNQVVWNYEALDKVWCLKFVGDLIVHGGHNGNLVVYNWKKMIQMFSFQAHESRVKAISAYKQYIVTGSFDQTVCIWKLTDQKLERKYECHEDWVRAICIGNNFLASGGDDSKIIINFFEFDDSKKKQKTPQKSKSKQQELKNEHLVIKVEESGQKESLIPRKSQGLSKRGLLILILFIVLVALILLLIFLID